jgi:hypothetical protein
MVSLGYSDRRRDDCWESFYYISNTFDIGIKYYVFSQGWNDSGFSQRNEGFCSVMGTNGQISPMVTDEIGNTSVDKYLCDIPQWMCLPSIHFRQHVLVTEKVV